MDKSYTDILNNIPGGIALYRVGNKLETLIYTDGIPKMQGFTREEYDKAIARDAMDIVYDADRPLLAEMLGRSIAYKEALHISYRVYCKDGSLIWVNLSAYPAEYREGEAPLYRAIFSNTTSQFNLYQDVCDNSTSGILVFDKKSYAVYYANGTMFKFSGLEQGSYTNMLAMDFFDTDISEEENNLFKKGETSFVRKQKSSGKVMQMHIREICWLNRPSVLVYATDITSEYKQQEELQRRYEEQVTYSRMLSGNSIASSMVNLTKNCITLQDTKNSDIMKVITKQTPQQGFEAMYPHIPDKNIRKKYADIFNTDTIIADFENGVTHKSIKHPYDNMFCWMESGYDAVRNPKNGDLEIYCFANDITEQELQRDISSSLISHDYEDVILINPETGEPRIIVDSTKSQVFDEQKKAEDYSLGLENYFMKYCADADALRTGRSAGLVAVKEALEKDATYSISYSLYDNEHRIIRKKAVYSYLNEHRTYLLCTVQNITKDFEKEVDQREKLQNALEESQRAMRAKTDFLSRISHDMRTPMNGILGLAELSLQEDNIEVLKEDISKIRDSGNYLLSLINDTLDLQRIESGKITLEKQIVSTATILNGILDIIRPAMEQKKINFKVINENADINWYIRLDPVRFKQIFVNLLSNACKFTPEGGTVTFAFGCTGRDDMISHDYLRISDNGCGMSEEFMKNGLFKPFSQESNKVTTLYAGSGLGLSIVKNLVELMGGRIEVESALGKGTTFTVYIDFERVEQTEAETLIESGRTQLSSTEQELTGWHILLVEDHPLNAEIAKRMLERTGCIVSWAQNGKDGVEAFEASEEDYYSAILMDVRMPIMDGLEAAKTIRALDRADCKTVPIIAMTANAYDVDVRNTAAAGMNAHLAKPVEPEQLFKTLLECRNGKNKIK